jgi:tubulin polyglutamylase TTLL5
LKHLESSGVNRKTLLRKINELIIKTIISIEPAVVETVRELDLHPRTCFDLFGFDILVDSAAKPWLVEVNLSPSMATDSPLDHRIKSELIADTLNIVGIKPFNRAKARFKQMTSRLKDEIARYQTSASQTTLSSPRSPVVPSPPR